MKKALFLALSFLLIVACDSKGEDNTARQQAIQDSINTMEAEDQARSIALRDSLQMDSMQNNLEAQESNSLPNSTNFEMTHMTLYQTDAELEVNMANSDDFVDWAAEVKEFVEQKANELEPNQKPSSVSIVVAVNVGQRIKVWILEHKGKLSEKTRKALEKAAQSPQAPKMRTSVASFSINANLFGGDMISDDFPLPPIPDEWMKVANSLSEPAPVSQLIEETF